MNEAEYNAKLTELRDKSNKAENDLILEYALSQAQYKVGDIISDLTDKIILIDKINGSRSYGVVVPVYYGICLRKDLKPMKKEIRGAIYHGNTNNPITLLKAGNM
jgi:hypothetical protein